MQNLIKEVVAKLALEPKFDDFRSGLVLRKLTYSNESRRFEQKPNLIEKDGFGPKSEFATTSRGSLV
jgi:hypothetical protein